MKFLLSASSLSRCLLRQSSIKRRCVTTAAAAASGNRSVCAVVRDNQSHRSKIIDIDVSRPCRRLMGTSASAQESDFDDDYLSHDDYDDVVVQEANERSSGQVEIKKVTPEQWGVFTSRPYTKGSIVVSSNLAEPGSKAKPCSHSIQTNVNEHIMMDAPAILINHSCDPNVGVAMQLNEGGSYDFVALRDIQEGEELRFDYETTEYVVGAFEDCMCGADNCRGNIKGFKYNKDVLLEQYGGKNIIAAHLMG